MAGTAGFTNVHVLVVEVANLADHCGAVHTDQTDFAGRQTNLSQLAVLRHQLRSSAGGTNQLSATARIQLDVVDHGTDGDVGQRQAVAGLDIGSCG